jgi:hypothetical protein
MFQEMQIAATIVKAHVPFVQPSGNADALLKRPTGFSVYNLPQMK